MSEVSFCELILQPFKFLHILQVTFTGDPSNGQSHHPLNSPGDPRGWATSDPWPQKLLTYYSTPRAILECSKPMAGKLEGVQPPRFTNWSLSARGTKWVCDQERAGLTREKTERKNIFPYLRDIEKWGQSPLAPWVEIAPGAYWL